MAMIVSVDRLRLAARQTLPRWLFDYLDGGSYSESTLHRNIAALSQWRFVPQVLGALPQPDVRSSIFGRQQDVPIVLAPVGMAGMLSPDGEIKAARAAAGQGVQACVSHFSIMPIERIAQAVDPDFLAFQLYIFRNRDITRDMVSRAWDCGIHTLVVTVDTPVTPLRERDARNGFRNVSRLSGRHVAQMMVRPRWTFRAARAKGRTIGNLDRYGMGSNLFAQAATIAREIDPHIGWDDIRWLRDTWKGRLVVKGVMQPDDSAQAGRLGVDALVLSNHGGRQLDGAVAAIELLEDNIKAAGSVTEILVDGGFRYGTDVVKAMALGAAGVMIGRPYAYGLAADGEQGVADVLDYFRQSILSTMTLLGAPDIAALRDNRGRLLRNL
jgi:L-lactate dehydrogenase (cytochrome)